MGGGQPAFVLKRDTVGAQFEWPAGRHGGLFLSQTAGGSITGVNKRLLSLVRQTFVQGFEPFPGHIHLSPDLHQLRDVVTTKFQGHRRDGTDVGGDILTCIAITACSGPGQHARFVMKTNRQPIQLGLADILNVVFGLEPISHPAVKVPQFFITERIVQGKHGDTMDNLLKGGFHRCPHPASGGIRRHNIGVLRFEVL